jgi:hypothetical protein
VPVSFEHGNDPLVSIQYREFLGWPIKYQLLRKDPAPWAQSVSEASNAGH